MTISEIFAGLTTVGLFFSVLLVYLELRRNGIATRLNNNLIFTERHFNLRNAMFDKNFSEVVVRGRESLANLDEADNRKKEKANFFVCPICAFVVTNPLECDGCQSLFCKDCIDPWRSNNESCPKKCRGNEAVEYNKVHRFVMQ